MTVVIPCYNYGHFLPAAVDSALSQPGVDVDVVIVDDASPDGSAEVATRLAAGDPRIRVVLHEINRRHIATYNDGLALARGDYVILLSADDLLTPGHLERGVALMEARPDVGLVYGHPLRFTDELPEARIHTTSWTVWSGVSWIRRICRLGQNLIFTPEAIMRTSLMHQLVGYDKRLPSAADFHLWLRAASRMNVGRVNGCDQGYYREHGSNMHLTTYAGLLVDIRERMKTFTLFFAEDGRRLPGHRAMYSQARRSIARECIRLARDELDAGGSDLELFEAFLAMASELRNEPPGTKTPGDRRRIQRVAAGQTPSLSQRAVSQKRDLVQRARWHRWYRLGT